jgi:cytochrome P450
MISNMSVGDQPAAHVRPDFNPLAPDYLRDPYPILEAARREQPVFLAPQLGIWVVTRYEDLLAVTADWQTFSQSAARLMPVPAEIRDRVTEDWFEEAFMNADPPVHTVARKAVNAGFTRSRILAMEPRMRETAHRLIDGFAADGRCEFMSQYAYPMGATTLATFVGLPVADMPRLKAWAQDLLILAYPRNAAVPGSEEIIGKDMSHAELVERWTRMAECREYLHEQIRRRVEHPQEDLISTLVHLRDDAGEPALKTERIVTHLIDLIAAGTDTVAPLTAQLLKFLIEDPEQFEAVRSDSSLLENAVEEALRARGTGNLLLRYTSRAAEIGGVPIPAGSVVALSYAAGGRDEEKFACPHQFDVRRAGASDHLAFGRGRHFCIGAPLARAQARISVEAMLERLPDLRLAPGQRLDYHSAIGVFMLQAIAFEWSATA